MKFNAVVTSIWLKCSKEVLLFGIPTPENVGRYYISTPLIGGVTVR